MAGRARKVNHEQEENIFWVTMSDLFLGMFMIFATLFFAFVTYSGTTNSSAQDATQQMVQEVVKELKKENIKVKMISEDKPEKIDPKKDGKIDLEMDPNTGLVRISNLELFKLNSAEITPQGRFFLGKFIPIYFKCIYKKELAKYISSVVVQGHTDTINFKGNYSTEQQYMKNMNLSMNRAYNVTDFIFAKCSGQSYGQDLTHTIRVEGDSSSRPIVINGQEDFDRSRRVELRIVLKKPSDDVVKKFMTNGGNYEDYK